VGENAKWVGRPGDETAGRRPPAAWRPAIRTTITLTNPTRAREVGPSKRTTPSDAVPTAPIPARTAYAVPIGRSSTGCGRKSTLATTVPSVGPSFENSSEHSRSIAHAVSNAPARIRRDHGMWCELRRRVVHDVAER